jgi:hypothetical protein
LKIGGIAEGNARLLSDRDSTEVTNQNVYQGICENVDVQNEELRRTRRNAAMSGFEKLALQPFAYKDGKWKEAWEEICKDCEDSKEARP